MQYFAQCLYKNYVAVRTSFQTYTNDVLHSMLNVFCTAYIDDILIYSNLKKKHWEHICKVLAALQAAGLQTNIKNVNFMLQKSIRLVITSNRICIDLEKISAVQEWNTPTRVWDMQVFIGFANFYRRFIHGFSSIVAPMIATVKKSVKFEWTNTC